MSVQSHQSDPKILGRRTLQKDHRILAGLVRPGLSVLDVGCGTGAITSGIATAMGTEGRVVGMDRDEGHLTLAREQYSGLANLTFEHGDATSLSYRAQFDVGTAARTLQWITQPERTVLGMKQAAKPGGIVVVLDYNHAKNEWTPDPPPEFRHFYRAFLAWRHANQWDNAMADRLPGLLQDADLTAVESHPQDEVTERGDPDFAVRAAIWLEVVDNVGERIASAGFCTLREVREASECYGPWTQTELLKQRLALSAVTGRVPPM
jgi:SAM-dependent methyltransferase